MVGNKTTPTLVQYQLRFWNGDVFFLSLIAPDCTMHSQNDSDSNFSMRCCSAIVGAENMLFDFCVGGPSWGGDVEDAGLLVRSLVLPINASRIKYRSWPSTSGVCCFILAHCPGDPPFLWRISSQKRSWFAGRCMLCPSCKLCLYLGRCSTGEMLWAWVVHHCRGGRYDEVFWKSLTRRRCCRCGLVGGGMSCPCAARKSFRGSSTAASQVHLESALARPESPGYTGWKE